LEREIHQLRDVLCARDVPLLGRDDEIQLDFVEEGKQHWGIIIARRRACPGQVVACLLNLLNQVTAGEMKGQL